MNEIASPPSAPGGNYNKNYIPILLDGRQRLFPEQIKSKHGENILTSEELRENLAGSEVDLASRTRGQN